jgi:uncharacterized membrane protein
MKQSLKMWIRHESFRAGITLKGVDGVLELIGAALLWAVKPETLNHAVRFIFQHELSRDPHDFLAAHVLHATQRLEGENKLFAELFLLSHGLIKIIIVTALWLDQLWAYPLAIVIFSAFGVYQTYRWTHTHSFFLAVLTVFDAAIVYLTWAEFRVQKRKLANRAVQ